MSFFYQFKIKTKYTLFLLYILTPILFYSQSDSESQSTKILAIEYMKAYGKWDFDTMKTYHSEDIHFEDLTGSEAFDQKFDFHGKENVLAFFKNVFKGGFENDKPPYVDFKIEKIFESGSFIIINSTFESLIPNSWFGKNTSDKILISIPFLTILQIKNARIISHKDYGDYNTYKKQIKAQLNN
ncbi:nuclear transport factor 2 family protein [Lutibacter maritimus]|uniref:SnoaL-like domain-containing protein n=1 Tax=Lutibacter maritimus TaxID=593133 RepID=A0A1I6RZ37_9FLAO|nr:nuclear transport factor 2 family protein [Lutibacter maritimus]SFS69973.1 SnoaL-like domain-containing protein [Lutibacter maritimus]